MTDEQVTNFTVVEESDNYEEWPNGARECRVVVEGVLADDIRKKLGVDPSSTVEILQAGTDGGYSEYTQETDYSFELFVNGERVLSETWGVSPIYYFRGGVGEVVTHPSGHRYDWNLAWLLKWLDPSYDQWGK